MDHRRSNLRQPVDSSVDSSQLNVERILRLLRSGISITTFNELLKEQLHTLSYFMVDQDCAMDILESTDREGENHELYEMLLAWHDLQEPYLKWLMRRYLSKRYIDLRDRLSIDVKLSWMLCGVEDKHQILGPDEVYICLPHRHGIIIGRVVVERSTGETVLLKAVNKPGLRRHTNCVVFPRRETRPYYVPNRQRNERFWVCSDPRLVPRFCDAFRPSMLVSLSVAANRATLASREDKSIKDLQDTIPAPVYKDITCWRPDPDLILASTDPRRWQEHYIEGERLINDFYRELSDVIGSEEEWDEAYEEPRLGSASSFVQSEHQSATEPKLTASSVKKTWIARYFSGTPSEHTDEQLRASAWYKVGYEHKKRLFAWLGFRQLNMIKATANLDGKLPLPIGQRTTPLRPSTSNSDAPMKQIPASKPGHHSDKVSVLELELRSEPGPGLEQAPAILVASNPKPLAPVVTRNLGICQAQTEYDIEHKWDLKGSNGSSRKYTCRVCKVRVDERKKDGMWVTFDVTRVE